MFWWICLTSCFSLILGVFLTLCLQWYLLSQPLGPQRPPPLQDTNSVFTDLPQVSLSFRQFEFITAFLQAVGRSSPETVPFRLSVAGWPDRTSTRLSLRHQLDNKFQFRGPAGFSDSWNEASQPLSFNPSSHRLHASPRLYPSLFRHLDRNIHPRLPADFNNFLNQSRITQAHSIQVLRVPPSLTTSFSLFLVHVIHLHPPADFGNCRNQSWATVAIHSNPNASYNGGFRYRYSVEKLKKINWKRDGISAGYNRE